MHKAMGMTVEERLTALREKEDELMKSMDRLTFDIEKVRFAIRILTGESVEEMTDWMRETPITGPIQVSSGGSISALSEHIRRAIEGAQRDLSTEQITDALFYPGLPFTRREFKRRVSVQVSDMHKKGKLFKAGKISNDAVWSIQPKYQPQ